jgi:hypothetical protein
MRELYEINIDQSLLDQLEKLPDKHAGSRIRNPTEQELEIVAKYWNVKRQVDLCKLLGVSVATARRWYEEMAK